MSKYNKTTRIGVRIMLLGVLAGYIGLMIDLAFAFSSFKIGTIIGIIATLVMFFLYLVGVIVSFVGIFWEHRNV